jgi:predicted transcriptional regulator
MPVSRALLAAVLSGTLLGVGYNTCKATSPTGGENLTKIRVGYIGITCEAPIFCAVENGFFKEEGLDVELVKCEWSKYKDVLALGGFDITHHLIMYLKPIEQGLDVKFTAGIHQGCLRVQTATSGNIKTAAIQLMDEKNVGALPVVDNKTLVGIVSERDYTRKVIVKGGSPKDTPVSDIMTKRALTVNLSDTVTECMRIMTERRVRHLPVLEGTELVGILSIGVENARTALDSLWLELKKEYPRIDAQLRCGVAAEQIVAAASPKIAL